MFAFFLVGVVAQSMWVEKDRRKTIGVSK